MSEPKPISAVHFNPTPNLREGSSKVAADAVVGTLTASDGIGDIIYLLAREKVIPTTISSRLKAMRLRLRMKL